MTSTRITQLKFYPSNARRGDIDLIADSLRVNGQCKPVVVNKGTHAPDLADTLPAGNHTVMAAQRLGWHHVDTHYVDVDATAAKRILLADNRANDQAAHELEELAALVGDIGNLGGTGFTQDDLDAILEALDNTTDDLLEEGDAGVPESYDLTVECGSANQRDTLEAKLISEGFTVS